MTFATVLAVVGLWRQPPQGGGQDPNEEDEIPISTTLPAGATADSNHRMIAVTGTDITGASILYLVDTVNYQLAVYQATGGASSTQGVKFVGARRIDLDMRVDGYNDKSTYTFKQLRDKFIAEGKLQGAQTSAGVDPTKE